MRKRYGVVYVNRENHDLKDLKRAEEELRVVETGYPYQRTRDVSCTLPGRFCD
jgi:beta-glucosidase/6-phospho-beta-glucosidase/beta-galactosidase